MVADAGMSGINALTLAFTAKHPSISKRQCEIKINEIGEKDKRAGDSSKVWYIRPEFEKYLLMKCSSGGEAMETDEPPKKKAGKAAASTLASGGSSGSLIKRKREEGTKTPASKQKKSSAASTPGALTPLVNSNSNTPNAADGGALVAPKKFKRAFGFFVKARRYDAEAQVKEEAAGNGNEVRRHGNM